MVVIQKNRLFQATPPYFSTPVHTFFMFFDPHPLKKDIDLPKKVKNYVNHPFQSPGRGI
jgi:hypothetical protein